MEMLNKKWTTAACLALTLLLLDRRVVVIVVPIFAPITIAHPIEISSQLWHIIKERTTTALDDCSMAESRIPISTKISTDKFPLSTRHISFSGNSCVASNALTEDTVKFIPKNIMAKYIIMSPKSFTLALLDIDIAKPAPRIIKQ